MIDQEFAEHALLVVARLVQDLHDACPEVGMGPFPRQTVEEAAELLMIKINESTKMKIVRKLKGRS